MNGSSAPRISFPDGAGCGGAGETSSGSSTAAADEPPPPIAGEEEEVEQRPPQFALVTASGRQNAVQSSYCVTGPTTGTCAEHVETGPPRELSVVGPGEEVEFVFEDVETVAGSVAVVRLGCSQKLTSIELDGPETAWQVDLEPGLYELELSAVFTTATTNGDTSASLGVQVDPGAEAEIVPVPDPPPACPGGQSR